MSSLGEGHTGRLLCKEFYVGQTGRCADDRLRQHGQNLTNDAVHLPTHCGTCRSRFCDTMILGSIKNQKSMGADVSTFYQEERCSLSDQVPLLRTCMDMYS